MKIKKITEIYKPNFDDDDDSSREHAKLIISKYIDDLDKDKTLQDSFDFYCKEIDEELRYIVSQVLLDVIYDINESRDVEYTNEYYIKKDSKKYNL